MSIVYSNPVIFFILFWFAVVAIGHVLVWVAHRSPAASWLQGCAGVAGPIASVLALLFGLLTAFLANDVTSHTERARVAVTREADALAVVLHAAKALGDRGQPLGQMASEFGQRSTAADWTSERQAAAAAALGLRMLNEIMFGSLANLDSPVRQTLLSSVMEMRAARNDLTAVAQSQTSRMKWFAAFILGVLTQMAVVAVHLGKPRAAKLAVTLFACGMTFMLWIVLLRLDPFGGKNSVSLAPITAAYESAAPR